MPGRRRRRPAALPLLRKMVTEVPLLPDPAGSVLATVPAGQGESICVGVDAGVEARPP